MNSDGEWEKWGRRDPYYAVLTDTKFRRDNLTPEAKSAFFESGRIHIAQMFHVIRDTIDPAFSPKRALDFGCGTGRIVIPLAAMVEHVVGVDVSESMLREAVKNCGESAVRNVEFIRSDDALSAVEGRFDFIHSYIVFQHIPTERGKRIFRGLLDRLAPGGAAALHFTYSTIFNRLHGSPPRLSWRVRNRGNRILRRLRYGDSPNGPDPEMEMNSYSMNELMSIMQDARIRDFHARFTDHDGEFGVFLYFRKPSD